MFKNGILCWEFCPACDGKLIDPAGIGDGWECSECGEFGTREPGKYDVTFADWLRKKEWERSLPTDGDTDGITAAGAASDHECEF